ncbi:hypothetical protein M0813_28828 [Anaeramoeba flamelloides]|uniref:Uncharacterized protein n=1 Tax=Anaeramoeba flamelloides TaxID=1746091 RepID=A0ABQ8XQG9_9EUKA|nr:hypothetical protein M0813_28828 [Anaeramoeba flamelloides]
MISLLNNVHCPCGRKKILKDLKEGYGSFKAFLLCPNCPIKQWEDNEEFFFFSKKLDQMDGQKKPKKKIAPKFKTEIGQRKIIASVLAGNFYENYREQMEMLGISYLKKNAYYKTIGQLIDVTNILFQKHLEENRSKMDLQNLTICIDAGWSSRRNANECCFIVIDKKTRLLFDLIVVTRETYLGASGNMEAEAARIFCEKHKKTINLVGVVKDGDTKLAQIYEAAWNNVEILRDLNHLLKNLREKIQKESSFRCVKNIKVPITKWIRSKCETSWHKLELKIHIELSIFHFLNSHHCCDHSKSFKDHYDFPYINIKDKRFLIEKKIKIQNDIAKYLTILTNNIKNVKKKLFLKKQMKNEDKLHLEQVLNVINNKFNYFYEKNISLYHDDIHFLQESEKEEEEKYSLTPQLIELSNLIDELSDRAEEFFTSGSTNKNESFMNSRTKFIEKRINSRKQWEMRCQFSALNRELPEWKTILMDQLGFTINLPQIISQYKKNTEKDYEKIRQNTQEYKRGRFGRKIKKFTNKNRIEEEGRYLFKNKNENTEIKKKFSCRYLCITQYKTKLSRLIHEIIFHKRVPVLKEKDLIVKDLKLTKKKLYLSKSSLNQIIKTLQSKINKNNLIKDKINFNKKKEALKNLLNYIEEFENTFKIKKKMHRTKTLVINPEEFNNDIEIFKEINDNNQQVDGLIEESFQGEGLFNENEMDEIEEILTNERKNSNDLNDDSIFNITFDKRLPSSFITDTLLFETERNKKK